MPIRKTIVTVYGELTVTVHRSGDKTFTFQNARGDPTMDTYDKLRDMHERISDLTFHEFLCKLFDEHEDNS